MKKYADLKIYRKNDLTESFYDKVRCASYLWAAICKENIKKYGDIGSCVIGAGIAIRYLPKRHRYDKSLMIIDARDISGSQSSMSWERRIDEVIDYLHAKGIDAFYKCGSMD